LSIALVSGALANKPGYGGEAWVRTSWLRGLDRLGFDTCFVEQISAADCVGAEGREAPFETCVNREFFERSLAAAAPGSRAALVLDDGPETAGMAFSELRDLAGEAEVLINISGHLEIASLKLAPRRRAYVDVDPGFTQIWEEGEGSGRLGGHDLYFTVGENIGSAGCAIPTAGIDWRPLPPPVVLEDWPLEPSPGLDRFTTVAGWRSPLGELGQDGVTFPGKHHAWRAVMDLPRRSPHAFEIALDIHPGDGRDLDALIEHGWRISDPRAVAADPESFAAYVRGSGAEFSVAHGAYVETRSGWLSDRTVRYLASGRPALVQDTGIGERYPVGEGLLTFATIDDAVTGAEAIAADYEAHASAARALAERRFESDRVIGGALEQLGVS
jgi:hypothetical protein